MLLYTSVRDSQQPASVNRSDSEPRVSVNRFSQPKSARGFAKIGPEIMNDDRATRDHLRVYWAMARSVPKGTNLCKLGQRLIGETAKLSQPTTNRRVADLIAWGHVKKSDSGNGYRATYELTSQAFTIQQKQQRPVYVGKSKRKTERDRAAGWSDSRQALDEILAG